MEMGKYGDEILVVATGGSIDMHLDDETERLELNVNSQVPLLLRRLGLGLNFLEYTVCMKDSTAITEDDRNRLYTFLNQRDSKRVIITHGLRTMYDTAKDLSDRSTRDYPSSMDVPVRSIANKTVVLVGANRPAGFPESDAITNLCIGIGAVQALPSGIYFVKQGGLYVPNNEDGQRYITPDRRDRK